MFGFTKMANNKLQLILASASPRRKELLGHLKIPFEIVSSNVPEESSVSVPHDFAIAIADLKGRAVLEELRELRRGEDFYIVAADTIVTLDGKFFGKPRDREEAREFLSELSGRTHSVFTGVKAYLLSQNQLHEIGFAEETRVTFERISPHMMENYLNTKDSLDKAGAYGIQGGSLTFISKVEGCYSNVVGFPLSRFIRESEALLSKHFPGALPWSIF